MADYLIAGYFKKKIWIKSEGKKHPQFVGVVKTELERSES